MAITNRVVSELAKKTKALPDLVTKEDLLQASKAIHDSVKESVFDKFQTLDIDLGSKVVKILEGRFDKSLSSQLAKSLGDLKEQYDKQLGLVESKYTKRLEDIQDFYSKKFLDLERKYQERENSQEEKFLLLQKMHEIGLENIKTLLEKISIPAPRVEVKVPKQETPIVNVAVPESKPPDIHVNVPEARTPDVHVNVPEQKSPDVHVNVPSPRLVKKSLRYDEFNRPVEISEEEVS